MDISIFNTDTDTLPPGWVLVKGNHLANIARSLKVAFRLAVSNPVKRYGGKVSSHKVPVGILVQVGDEPAMAAGRIKAAARKAREAAAQLR